MSYLPQSRQCGVHWDSKVRKWAASIGVRGRMLHLGYFINEEDAVRARLQAEENREKLRSFFKFEPRHNERFNPFNLVSENRYFENYQPLIAEYKGNLERFRIQNAIQSLAEEQIA